MAILRIQTAEIGGSQKVLRLGEDPVRLGRADDNDVVLLESGASRHHARIEPLEDGYEVVDLGSSGGLTVGGETVDRKRLVDGDEIVIASTRIEFVRDPGSQATVLPTTPPPSRQDTEVGEAEPMAEEAHRDGSTWPGLPSPPTTLGDADTILPTHGPTEPPPEHDASTLHAPHQPAPPPATETVAAPHLPASAPAGGTVAASHSPAPAPLSAPQPEPMQPPENHKSSEPSFVLGGPSPSSSPSDYTLEGPGQSTGRSGGYSLDGGRDASMGGLSIDTTPPTALQRGPGAGLYLLLAMLGAGASFGVLAAVQGVPW